MARTYQEAVRNGTLAAGKLHREIDLRARQDARPSAVDVFGVIADLGVPLMMRPLTGLLVGCSEALDAQWSLRGDH